jgi:hypothetical protein
MVDHTSWQVGRSSRRHIDVAIGVLIALRRCSEQQGFQCIADAVRETGVGLSGVSHALITLASGDDDSRADSEAIKHWRHTISEWTHASRRIASQP